MGLMEIIFGETNNPMDTKVGKAAKENFSNKYLTEFKSYIREAMESREIYTQYIGKENNFSNPTKEELEKLSKGIYKANFLDLPKQEKVSKKYQTSENYMFKNHESSEQV